MTASVFYLDSIRQIGQLLPNFKLQYDHLMEDCCGTATAVISVSGKVKFLFFIIDDNQEWVYVMEYEPTFHSFDPDNPDDVCGFDLLLLIAQDESLMDFIRLRDSRKDDAQMLASLEDFKELLMRRAEEIISSIQEQQQLLGELGAEIKRMIHEILPKVEAAFDDEFSPATGIQLARNDEGAVMILLTFKPVQPNEELADELFGKVNQGDDEDEEKIDPVDQVPVDLGVIPDEFENGLDWSTLFSDLGTDPNNDTSENK